MLISRRRCLSALAGMLLAACATAPPVSRTAVPDSRTDESFEARGRLSARHGNEAAAANFRWTHRPGRDQFTLASPLGSTLAQLEGTLREVRLELPDGRVIVAPDWEALTSKVLGAPIPVRGLAWWLRGLPHPDSAHSVERDAAGRASVLRQDGWEIVIDYGESSDRATRLRLTYPDTELRLVIDAWGDA